MIREFFFSIIPPIFAILTIISENYSSKYLEEKINDLVGLDGLTPETGQLLKLVSMSSVALVNFVTTIFSCLLSIIIIFLRFPKGYSVLLVLIFFVYQRWIWETFSLRIDEISGQCPPKKNAKNGEDAHEKITYAQLLSRRQCYLNFFIIVLIAVGFIQKYIIK